MNWRIHHRTMLRFVVSCLLIVLLPAWQAEAQQRGVHLGRHAKKMHRTLAEYPSGSFLHLALRDHTEKFGSLGTLSSASFEFTDANTAATASISYDDVDHVNLGSSSAVAGMGGRPHHRGSVGFLVIIGVAAAVAVAVIVAARN